MSKQTKYLYIVGSVSGVGKTALCEGLLAQLLLHSYQPEHLAYIKPMTQCTDKQAVTVFCERQHIAHQSIGCLVFKKGFTQHFIDHLSKNSLELLEDILAEIACISKNKRVVIVDGVGGPSTGSVVGVSNINIALALGAPVLFVGKAGIGAAIDDTVLAVSFMQQQGINKIALVYNKILPSSHISTQHYVSKRLAELFPDVPVLDFIVNHPHFCHVSKQNAAEKIYQWFNSLELN